MTERTGRCLCGAVQYRLTVEPIVSRICWCKDCQHIAANGTVNAIFPSASIEITGTLNEYASKADSGNTLQRRFCPKCGCHLFADSSGRPGLTVVRIGTLDDPSSIKPATNIWTSSAPSWACMDASLDNIQQQPVAKSPPK